MSNKLKHIARAIKSAVPQDIVMYCRAVSICSVFTEKELCKASYKELADGLDERFGNAVERELIEENVFDAVQFGVQADLMEVDACVVTLTLDGIIAGEEWLKQLSAV